ncbi:MAG TPA: DUF5679 domain-containing protein [Anaerolineae bacterium]|nr:DUF5679 domain-containing protein [Anaerolineae bacterium]
MTDEVRAYCMKEKKEQLMKDVVITTTANGRRAAQGICSSCGTKMYKFLPKAAAEPAAEPMAKPE